MDSTPTLPDDDRVSATGVQIAFGKAHSTTYEWVRKRLLTKPVNGKWPRSEIVTLVAAHNSGMPREQIRKLVARLEEQRRLRWETVTEPVRTELAALKQAR